MASNPRKREEARKVPPLQVSKGARPCLHLDCGRLACRTERIHLCPRDRLLCGTLCGWAAAAPSGPRVSWDGSPSGVLVCSDLRSAKVSRCWALRGCEHSRKRRGDLAAGHCHAQVGGPGALSTWWQRDRCAVEPADRSEWARYGLADCGGTSVKPGNEVAKVIWGVLGELRVGAGLVERRGW